MKMVFTAKAEVASSVNEDANMQVKPLQTEELFLGEKYLVNGCES